MTSVVSDGREGGQNRADNRGPEAEREGGNKKHSETGMDRDRDRDRDHAKEAHKKIHRAAQMRIEIPAEFTTVLAVDAFVGKSLPFFPCPRTDRKPTEHHRGGQQPIIDRETSLPFGIWHAAF